MLEPATAAIAAAPPQPSPSSPWATSGRAVERRELQSRPAWASARAVLNNLRLDQRHLTRIWSCHRITAMATVAIRAMTITGTPAAGRRRAGSSGGEDDIRLWMFWVGLDYILHR